MLPFLGVSGTNPLHSRAIADRDAALARIRRARGWVIAGTAALSAGVAGLVSAIAPGRTLGGSKRAAPAAPAGPAAPRVGAGSVSAPKMPPLADPKSLGLGAPAQTPGAASQGAGVSSSGASPAPAPAPGPAGAPAPAPSPDSAPSASDPNAQAQVQSAPAPAPATPAPSSGGAVVSGGS